MRIEAKWLVVFSCIIIALIVFVYQKSPIKFIKARVPDYHFRGIITAKFLDSNDRDLPKFILNNENDDILNFENYDMYERAQIGDSIIKDSGTLKYILKHGDSITIFYPKIYGGKEIRDK